MNCPLCNPEIEFVGEVLYRHLFEVHQQVVVFTDMLPNCGVAYQLDMEDAALQRLDFGFHEGYPTAFTRNQEPDGIPNGSRVTKIKSERGDTRRLGAGGVVLGSLRIPSPVATFAYFIEWDDNPKLAVFVPAWKIQAVPVH